jgi:hypothetical protein
VLNPSDVGRNKVLQCCFQVGGPHCPLAELSSEIDGCRDSRCDIDNPVTAPSPRTLKTCDHGASPMMRPGAASILEPATVGLDFRCVDPDDDARCEGAPFKPMTSLGSS